MNIVPVPDPLAPLVDEVIRRAIPEIEKRLRASSTESPLLVKVSRAAELLQVHVDHVYRLIHNGELVGYPFPDPDSHMHVEYTSLVAVLQHRREQYHADHRRSRKSA